MYRYRIAPFGFCVVDMCVSKIPVHLHQNVVPSYACYVSVRLRSRFILYYWSWKSVIRFNTYNLGADSSSSKPASNRFTLHRLGIISWGSLYTEARGAVSALICAQDAACMTGVKCTRRVHAQSGSPGLASSLSFSRQIRYQAGKMKICRLFRLSGRGRVIRHLLYR